MDAASLVAELIAESRTLEYAGDFAAALQRLNHALQTAQTSGDAEAQASVLARLAWVHYRLGHYPETQALSQQALELAGPASPSRANAWINLGVRAMETGALDEVERYMLQAANLCREIGCQGLPIARPA